MLLELCSLYLFVYGLQLPKYDSILDPETRFQTVCCKPPLEIQLLLVDDRSRDLADEYGVCTKRPRSLKS